LLLNPPILTPSSLSLSLSKRSYEKGTPCFRPLVKHFGDRIVGEDGGIDRRALGGIVFADPAKRKELEGIVWPEIRRLMEQDIQALGEVGEGVCVCCGMGWIC
jgi:dephospho-CoA kinase